MEEENKEPVTETTGPQEVAPAEEQPQTSEDAPVEAPAQEPPKEQVVVTIVPPEKPKETPPKPQQQPHNRQTEPRKRFAAMSAEEKKAFIAKKNAEHMEILENCGYKPAAVSAIINTFASTEKGYEESRSRDHLILMLEYLANRLHYRVPRFTIDESSIFDSLLTASLADIIDVDGLFSKPDQESKDIVTDIFDSVWKRKERIMGDSKDAFNSIKQFLIAAINAKIVQGYAKRARYLLECILFVRGQQIEIFSGIFHEETVADPRRPAGWKPRPPVQMCPKCGKPMRYNFRLEKHYCPDATCENWEPPPKRFHRNDGDDAERISKNHPTGYDSGKPIRQRSGADRFREKYANRPKPKSPVQKAIDDMHKKGEEFAKKAGSDPWSALDGLTGVDQQAEDPSQETIQEAGSEQLPPPPEEVPEN